MLGRGSKDAEVQRAVGEIVAQLGKVRRGGTAEANLLFPMFTAGCDAGDVGVRAEILDRLRGVEGSGMTQVSGWVFVNLVAFFAGGGGKGKGGFPG